MAAEVSLQIPNTDGLHLSLQCGYKSSTMWSQPWTTVCQCKGHRGEWRAWPSTSCAVPGTASDAIVSHAVWRSYGFPRSLRDVDANHGFTVNLTMRHTLESVEP